MSAGNIAAGSTLSADRSEVEDFSQYRSMSAAAVVALLFGVLSIVAVLPDYWVPKAVPVVGMLLAVAAILRIRARRDELTGLRPAVIGLALSAFFLVAGSAYTVYSRIMEVPEGATPITYEQLKPTADKPNAAPRRPASSTARRCSSRATCSRPTTTRGSRGSFSVATAATAASAATRPCRT